MIKRVILKPFQYSVAAFLTTERKSFLIIKINCLIKSKRPYLGSAETYNISTG